MTAPILRAKWRNVDGKLRCAWCDDEADLAPKDGVSYGICRTHQRQLIAQARSDARQGKRPDQIAFSAKALFWSFFGSLAIVLAMWLWRFTR